VKEIHPFVRRLYDLAARDDRAALAELRRAFASPVAALPHVAPFLRRDASRREENALVLVGGLFALHPARGTLTLARAMRICAQKNHSVSLRFQALLDSDAEDLAMPLRHAVTLVRSKDIAIDYDDLLHTIRWWGSEDRNRQRRWAREFWGTAGTNEETAT
jgi:CRISPR system Cascade subunit CasB